MKKVAGTASVLFSYLLSPASVLALQVQPPENIGIKGDTSVSTILTSALNIIYVVSIILVLFYLIWGAFKWITSGGDKEAVAGARKTILHALIGLAILALALVIVAVIGSILKINILQDFKIWNLEGVEIPNL